MDRSLYDRLGRLKLAIDKKSNASMIGSRKSTRKGSSAEFSDFREYMPGDDIRGIDWNAYARLDRLYIKEYMEAEDGETLAFYESPYLETQALISETTSLVYERKEQTGIIVIHEQGNNRKDRYTSVSYGDMFFTQLEKDLMNNMQEYEVGVFVN